MNIKDMIKLIRPYQWYKNLVIFLGIFFSGNLLNTNYLIITILGFLVLIIISSSNYILNDIIDYPKDRLNPEKKNRPIASGRVKISSGIVLFLLAASSGLLLSYTLSLNFFYFCFGMILISTVYSVLLKKILFADILTISVLFVLRALSGIFLLDLTLSPWLIMGVFFLAIFLVLGKRYGEMHYLKDKAQIHRKVLKEYSPELIKSLLNTSLSWIIFTFVLYTFFSEKHYLFLTFPLFIYIIFRYYYLIVSNSDIARHPHKILKDIPLIIAGTLLFILTFILISVK